MHLKKLRQRIQLMTRKVVEQEDGTFKERWRSESGIWARVEPIRFHRKEESEGWGRGELPPLRVKVTIRDRQDAHPFQRIRWEGNRYKLVTKPQTDESGLWQTFVCQEVSRKG